MAVNDHSVGIFYLAVVKTKKSLFPPHVCGITEIQIPWHQGLAIVFPVGFKTGVAVGLWFKQKGTLDDEDLETARWLNPKWETDISINEIAHWGEDVEDKEYF